MILFLKISAEIAAVLVATRGPPVRIYSVLLGKADEVLFYLVLQYYSYMYQFYLSCFIFLLFFNVFLIYIIIIGEGFFFFQTMIGSIRETTGGKLIRVANFDKLIHQYEGEVGLLISDSY